MKIRPVGAELFLANGRTDLTKPTVVFRNFAKRVLQLTHVFLLRVISLFSGHVGALKTL